jgi:iron complex transport system ATP-binding protein
MLKAEQVSFAYRAASVLRDITLDVPQGALVGILGPNGCGKTTLLKILSGGLRPSRGTVTIDRVPLDSLGHRERAQRIAVVSQETHPAFDYTALEIALMGRYPWLGPFEVEGPDDLGAARDALEATGTAHLAARPFPTLSGGEKQRVVIASALAQLDHRRTPNPSMPSLLILDEPTTSLDLRYQLEVAALIGQLHDERGVTVLLSTHDLRLASTVCSHLILLSEGRILAEGATAQMLTPDLVASLYAVDRALVAPLLP